MRALSTLLRAVAAGRHYTRAAARIVLPCRHELRLQWLLYGACEIVRTLQSVPSLPPLLSRAATTTATATRGVRGRSYLHHSQRLPMCRLGGLPVPHGPMGNRHTSAD